MSKIDEIIFRCFEQGVYWGRIDDEPGLVEKPDKPIDRAEANQAIKALLLGALPEKHNAPLSPEFKANDEGFNQALEEVTKALTALFEGEQSK